jgi:hypothetical protein
MLTGTQESSTFLAGIVQHVATSVVRQASQKQVCFGNKISVHAINENKSQRISEACTHLSNTPFNSSHLLVLFGV